MVVTTEISVFGANSRKKELVISSLIPRKAVDLLVERLGQEAGDRANKALRQMNTNDMDLVQIRLGDRRIRIRHTA